MTEECPKDQSELACLREQNAQLKNEASKTPSACEVGAAFGGIAGALGFFAGPTGFLTTPVGAGIGCVVGMGYETARNKVISYASDSAEDFGEAFCRTAPDTPNLGICPDKSPRR